MSNQPLLISAGKLTRQALAGQVAIVTGSGGGIGFEAARALVWLGARVVIAENDVKKGKTAEKALQAEFGPGCALFVRTDIGDVHNVADLVRQTQRSFGPVDIVLNNATYAPLGGVTERSIKDWDASYRVNLRGPVLLAQACLPGMAERNKGVFVCVSSVGGAYMGAYETLKTAQVELARTLDGELEGKDVVVFTIGPGIVPTETMTAGVAQIASRYGKTPEEFYAMYKEQWLSVEAAGAGFAAAIALAPRFRGMETYSVAGLNAAGIEDNSSQPESTTAGLSSEQSAAALELCREVRATLVKEHEGWLKRSLFERNWMLRDFKQNAGMPVEQVLKELESLESCLQANEFSSLGRSAELVRQVDHYYQHYQALAQGAIKDPEKGKELTTMMDGWRAAAKKLVEALETP